MHKLPERIWAGEIEGCRHTQEWSRTDSGAGWGTPYIRADLVDELVKALEEARERVEHWADVASRADRTRYDTSDDLAMIDAALARIKGDGK